MKIIFIDSIHPYLKEKLTLQDYKCDDYSKESKSKILRDIKNYDGLVIRSRFKIDKKFIDKAENLKFIARAGSGLENIDTIYAKKKNIVCYNAAEGNRQAVAEHALAMLLNLMNRINIADSEVRNGIWKREKNRGEEISGKTVGIIGFGNVGSTFAKLLAGFNTKILTYDINLKSYQYQSSLKQIFQYSDIVSIHIPYNKDNRYYVNKDFIHKFKKPIYIINTSRGNCLNTSDLIEGLRSDKIKGACLDVLEYENKSFEHLMLKNNHDLQNLIKYNNVVLSPHIAGWSHESYLKISQILYQKIFSDFISNN